MVGIHAKKDLIKSFYGQVDFYFGNIGSLFFAATGKKQEGKAGNQNKFFHRIGKRLKGKIVVLQSKQRKH